MAIQVLSWACVSVVVSLGVLIVLVLIAERLEKLVKVGGDFYWFWAFVAMKRRRPDWKTWVKMAAKDDEETAQADWRQSPR